ncbi:arsenate reductase [Pedobacter immunditicola]|uniref:arsenate reductase n=1 Tax=Pedobacter immunditicola TaxID=3133440 RepID=UPI0030B451E8
MIIYGIPNCNTVKKAQIWLTEKGFSYEFHDFKKKGITAEKLDEWCNAFGWENVLNKKGTTWKKLSAEEQLAVTSQDTAIAVLLKHTSAIKRPVIEQKGRAILLGFNEAQYSAHLGV